MKKAFVSYSTQDKFVAREVSRTLKSLYYEPFLAHEDIHISENWRDRILLELRQCELFIPLVSRDFKFSEWCSMECGFIISGPEVRVLILSIDGTWPYGFLSAIQGGFVDINNDPNLSKLRVVIRRSIFKAHFVFAFDTLLDQLDRGGATQFQKGLIDTIGESKNFAVEHACEIVYSLERRGRKFCSSHNENIKLLKQLHDSIRPLLDEEHSRRLAILCIPIKRH